MKLALSAFDVSAYLLIDLEWEEGNKSRSMFLSFGSFSSASESSQLMHCLTFAEEQ